MIVIVGGGISGLAIGWYLARAGRAVSVFERDAAGRGATWAAAGMLAAHVEAEPGEERLLPLLLESRAMWAEFGRDLEAASGLAVDYRDEGTLVVALDRDDTERLKFSYDYHRSMGLEMEWLSGAEARRLEPHLASGVAAGVFSPLDHQVDNRKVVVALKAAFVKAGGALREHAEVEEILVEGGAVRGVLVGGERVEAEAVVIAAGAWSRNLKGLPDHLRPPVRPVKGQMLSLVMPADAPLLRHVVWGPGTCLVPRKNGRLFVGATVEEMSFDTNMTAGGVYDLLRRAWETLPGIYDLPIDEMWAGLRPTSRDDAPLLGPVSGPLTGAGEVVGEAAGLIMATGHHRNGILLAPITARAISHYILTGELGEDIKPFAPTRFAA
ncbi:MAG: glycine oxidase ThiO [Proteobacteria bacterium]|nr:glycine oxidase ThiO [Pseudomonadota bacterium]